LTYRPFTKSLFAILPIFKYYAYKTYKYCEFHPVMIIVFTIVLKSKCEPYVDSILYFYLIRHVQRYKKILDMQSVWVKDTYKSSPPEKKTEKKSSEQRNLNLFAPIFWRFS
jgi:hypothetical protein